MNKFATTFIGVLITIITSSQTYKAPITPTLKHLYQIENEIGTISNTDKLTLFPLKVGNQEARFKLIKNKTGLYALIDGTGQVYKATKINNDHVSFSRIDSTHFYGNTFQSINFSYKDTIYTFGGYGFWHMNGQLSHLNPGAEWSIDKIDKMYNTVNTIYSYHPITAKIYFLEFSRSNEGTYEQTPNTSIIEFDINKRKNILLGILNPKIDLKWKYFTIDAPSLGGLINFYDREIYLYQFSNNKIFQLTNSAIKDVLIGKAGAELQTTFEDAGKIYYSYNNDTSLRSFSISMNDFKEVPYPLYISRGPNHQYWILVLAIFILCIVGYIYFNRKRRRKTNNTHVNNTTSEVYTTNLNSNEFNSIETTLINKLVERSNTDSFLTVDELNSCLGIKKKTIEIQKRVRTEAINRINHKFNVNFNQETSFIERTRSNEDRRFFNYIINKDNANIYLKSIKI